MTEREMRAKSAKEQTLKAYEQLVCGNTEEALYLLEGSVLMLRSLRFPSLRNIHEDAA